MSVDLVLGALEYEAPLANPSPNGLYSAVTWVQDGGEVARFLGEGVRIRPNNYGAEDAVGIWDAMWCGEGTAITKASMEASGSVGSQVKFGVRPDIPDPFTAITVWAYDECDPTADSRAEVRVRVAQNLRLMEQIIAEMALAQRMMADVVDVHGSANLRDALSYVEGQLALTGTIGVVHASPEMASQEFGLVVGNTPPFRTPMGHRLVLGGGYVMALPTMLVATSPLYGWRTDVTLRDTFDYTTNTYVAIAERSLVIGYEKLVAAAGFS